MNIIFNLRLPKFVQFIFYVSQPPMLHTTFIQNTVLLYCIFKNTCIILNEYLLMHISAYVMRSEKSYTKSKNVILRKLDLKWFGRKISIFGFQWKYIESIGSKILTQIRVSSDDPTSNNIEKCDSITRLETIHKVANVVAKLSFS